MTISTHDSRPREGKALLGTDNMHDALPFVVEAEVGEFEVLDVLLEGLALEA